MLRQTTAAALLLGSLALLPAGPASAQAAHTWSGPTLLSTGNTTNGCSIRVPSATHSGSLGLSNIFISFMNRGTQAVRVNASAELSGNNSRKSGAVADAVIPPGRTVSVQAFPPGGSTLSNTTLRVTITGCALTAG